MTTSHAENPHDGAEKNRENLIYVHARKGAEIIDDTDGDQNPQAGEKLTLLQNIGLAGLPNSGGDIEHRLMGRQILRLHVLHHAESHADQADKEPHFQDEKPVQRTEHDLRQIRQLDVRFARKGDGGQQKKGNEQGTKKRP